MRKCWAEPLGSCSDKMSREHIVTRGTFADEEIFVQGFHWCRDNPVKIGLSGLTAKILCEKHNSQLSSVDDAGIETVKQFREFFRLANVRSRLKSRHWHVIHAQLDGIELERWYLKTLINVAFGRPFPVFKPDEAIRWEPSRELVEIAFGLKQFQPGAGLYFSAKIGQSIDPNAKFQIMTFTNSADELSGARFIHFGFIFVLNLDTQPLAKTVHFTDRENKTESFDVNFRVRAIQYTTTPKHLSHILKIGWPHFNVSENSMTAVSR